MPQPIPIGLVRPGAPSFLSALSDEALRSECARRGISDVTSADALNPQQIRGARGMLDWTLHRLAASSGVSVSTIKRIEEGHEGQTRPSKLAAIRQAFERAGVRFWVIGGVSGVTRGAVQQHARVAA